jgi:hypothetical protein
MDTGFTLKGTMARLRGNDNIFLDCHSVQGTLRNDKEVISYENIN